MFFDIGIKDFIDVLLVAFLLYYTYKLMKASGSIKVFKIGRASCRERV